MKKSFFITLLSILYFNGVAAQNIDPNMEIEMRESINQQCIHKVRAFTNHLAKIATKEEADSIKSYHIDACMDLFVGHGDDTKDEEGNVIIPAPRIEVTSVSTGKNNSYLIEQYLKRLKNLEYTKIVFKTSKCYLAKGGIKKIDDNKYTAAVTYYQVFVGYNGELVTYRDKTQKTVKIIITRDESGRFDVLLGDITVDSVTI